jgi:hypothetical protein
MQGFIPLHQDAGTTTTKLLGPPPEGTSMHIRPDEVIAKFVDIQKEVLIDRDFYGITPLYSGAEPSLE